MAVACFLMPQFGIAVERTRLTHLWGEPIALESAEGTLAAVSDESAVVGIKPGQAVSGARATCERLIVLPYDREAYEAAAHSIWDLFAIESSVVEPVSPELCYVELTGPDVVERARQLADELTARIRITVQAGVGRTKLVARRAAVQPIYSGGRQSAVGIRQERAPGFRSIYSDPDMVADAMKGTQNPLPSSLPRPGENPDILPPRPPSLSLHETESTQSGPPCRSMEGGDRTPRAAGTPSLERREERDRLHAESSTRQGGGRGVGGSGRGGRNSGPQANHLLTGEREGFTLSSSHPLTLSAFRWIPPGREAELLASLPLEKAPGIDPKLIKRLKRLGLKTLGDIPKIPPRELRRQLREVALILQRLVDGEDGDRVRPLWPPRRIEKEIAFEDDVCDRATVEEALRLCAESISDSLGQKHEYCRSLALTVQFADESCLQESEKPIVPLSSERAIHRAALRLLGRMPIDQPLIGVALRASDLGAGSGIQLALLDDNNQAKGLPHERARSLEATLTFLRKRYGVGAVLTLSRLRQARRIGLWTYPLGHLLDEPVDVATDRRGAPVRYWRRGLRRDVKRIQNRWKEAEWFWGALSERTVYRVETDPTGLSELHCLGMRWRLCSAAD